MGVSLEKNQELIYRGMLLKRGAGKGMGNREMKKWEQNLTLNPSPIR